MTAEKQELLTNWRAVHGELLPYRDPEAMPVDDSVLSLGIYLLREIALLRKELELLRKTRVIEPAFADGAGSQPTVRTRRRAEPTE